MIKFYIEFKTWKEGRVNVQWPLALCEETNEYRSRVDLSMIISESTVRATFIEMNPEKSQRFLEANISTFIMAAIIPAISKDEAINELLHHLGYCEIIGMCAVTAETEPLINAIMKNAET